MKENDEIHLDDLLGRLSGDPVPRLSEDFALRTMTAARQARAQVISGSVSLSMAARWVACVAVLALVGGALAGPSLRGV